MCTPFWERKAEAILYQNLRRLHSRTGDGFNRICPVNTQGKELDTGYQDLDWCGIAPEDSIVVLHIQELE